MQHLVTISQHSFNGITQEACLARELQKAIGNKRQYADWFNGRVSKYCYTKNEDFAVVHSEFDISLPFANLISRKSEIKSNQHGGDRKATNHIITLDMAKELAMLERSSVGREIRKYFIDCEKKLHSKLTSVTPNLLLEACHDELLRSNKNFASIHRYKKMGLNHREISWLVHRDVSTVRKTVRRLEACGLLIPAVNLKALQQQSERLHLV